MQSHRIVRAAGVVGMATLLSRILGYVRDMVIAYFFGTAEAADAFQKAAALYPTNGIPFNNLAQTFLMEGDIGNARKAARKAVELGGPLRNSFEETLRSIEQSSH